MHALILCSRVAGLNSRSWVKFRHLWSFGKLGRARWTARLFAEVSYLNFNFMIYLYLGSLTFLKKLEVAEILVDRPLFSPIICFCALSFGGLILPRQMFSAIRWRTFPSPTRQIFPRILSQSFRRAQYSSPKWLGNSPNWTVSLSQLFFCDYYWKVPYFFSHLVCGHGKENRYATLKKRTGYHNK